MSNNIGNEAEKKIFQQHITHNQETKRPIFIILIGPEGIGKTSFLLNYSKNLLGEYQQSDLLRIKDLSAILEKKHPIPIEKPAKNAIIPIEGELSYENRGVREINQRLQQPGFSGKKVLLVENIQRMTTPAVNAFLKTCEEPLPQRYIFATAENESNLLATLLSRAIVIKFLPLSHQEMLTFIKENHLETRDPKLQELLIPMSLGKPGSYLKIFQTLEKEPELENILLELPELLMNNHKLIKKHQHLKYLHERGMFTSFIDGRISYCSKKGDTEQAKNRINIKKLSSSNLSFENLLRYGLL